MADDNVDPEYALAEDVERMLSQEFVFDDQSSPDKEAIDKWLNEAQADVERETGHAWTEQTVTDEYYDIPEQRHSVWEPFARIKLRNRDIKTFDTDEGDAIEVWNGNEYVNYLTEKTEGRGPNGYWWMDYSRGFLYLRMWHYNPRQQGLRMTYRWGADSVPHDIRQATAQLAAALLVLNDDKVQLVTDTGNEKNATVETKAKFWKKDAMRKLRNHQEFEVM